jgi:hypothetical protein
MEERLKLARVGLMIMDINTLIIGLQLGQQKTKLIGV